MRFAKRFLLFGWFVAQTTGTMSVAFASEEPFSCERAESRYLMNEPHRFFEMAHRFSVGDCEQHQTLAARVAFRQGELEEALGLYAPHGVVQTSDLSILWETAIVAAELQKNAISIEAYLKLLGNRTLTPRERLAARLEFAAVLSRGGEREWALLDQVLSPCDRSCQLPDNVPWVTAVTAYLCALTGEREQNVPLSVCGATFRMEARHARYLERYLASELGTRTLSGPIAREQYWLHLSTNERRAVLALAVDGSSQRLSRTLIDGIRPAPGTALEVYQKRHQAARGR